MRVHCHLEGEDASLIPGLYFKALIETNPQQVATLPDEAIVSFDNKYFVFIESEPGKRHYKMIEIQKGEDGEGFTKIELPVSTESKKIVLKGTYALLSILKNTEE